MRILAYLLTEVLGNVAGAAVSSAAERPAARLWRGLRRHISLPLVALAWLVAIGAMVVGWRIGTQTAAWWASPLALLLWIGAPVLAIVVSAAWLERYAA
jgi:hypothetical protein